jgi:hypothetical protein
MAASMYSNWLAQRYILADNTVQVYIQHEGNFVLICYIRTAVAMLT